MSVEVKVLPEQFEQVLSNKPMVLYVLSGTLKTGMVVWLKEFLGLEEIDECPNHYNCDGRQYLPFEDEFSPCPLDRVACVSYRQPKYSGRKISVVVKDVFGVVDGIGGYEAFTFTIRGVFI